MAPTVCPPSPDGLVKRSWKSMSTVHLRLGKETPHEGEDSLDTIGGPAEHGSRSLGQLRRIHDQAVDQDSGTDQNDDLFGVHVRLVPPTQICCQFTGSRHIGHIGGPSGK